MTPARPGTGRRRLIAAAAGALAVPGACAAPARLPAVPREATLRATIPGIPGARFFADQPDEEVTRRILATQRAEHEALVGRRPRGAPRAALPVVDVLAVSGGGEDGAFGAGVLTAWTRTGTRHEFRLVTGVSTGALTAPFAFLGPAYDARLEEVYTRLAPSEVLRKRYLTAAIFNDAIFDTAPLFATISRILDEAMLADIAREYGRGRLLLVGTTDLDARRPVIWNLGAIAASGSPRALDLTRRLLLASAAIPGAFPPVMIDVEADGRRYQEMHVDGGAIAQMFLFPAQAAAAAIAAGAETRPVRVWLIRNGRLDPDWAATDRRAFSIAGAAVATMIHTSGTSDVGRIWRRAQRDGFGFNLAHIGQDFTDRLDTPFEPSYMRALFAYGQRRVADGRAWVAAPPWAF